MLQAPNEAFQSVPTLARYLSGEAKRDDIINKTDVDEEDPIGDKNIPLPKPSKSKKTDIIKDPTRFKAIDENAKNVSYRNIPKCLDRQAKANSIDGSGSTITKTRLFKYIEKFTS